LILLVDTCPSSSFLGNAPSWILVAEESTEAIRVIFRKFSLPEKTVPVPAYLRKSHQPEFFIGKVSKILRKMIGINSPQLQKNTEETLFDDEAAIASLVLGPGTIILKNLFHKLRFFDHLVSSRFVSFRELIFEFLQFSERHLQIKQATRWGIPLLSNWSVIFLQLLRVLRKCKAELKLCALQKFNSLLITHPHLMENCVFINLSSLWSVMLNHFGRRRRDGF